MNLTALLLLLGETNQKLEQVCTLLNKIDKKLSTSKKENKPVKTTFTLGAYDNSKRKI